MDADLNNRLARELKSLQHERDIYTHRLEQCNGLENVSMHSSTKPGGKTYYYGRFAGSDRYAYIGRGDSARVRRIREAHCLKESIRRIDHNIGLLRSVTNGFLPYDPCHVSASLRKVYRTDVYPVSDAYRQAGEAWMADRLEFQKRFPENYPEHKTERASDGIMVKTLSELLVYERFRDAGFYEIYELPLVLQDYGPVLYPDLTVLSPVDMKTEIIVEFVGRLDLQQYREGFARKVGRYIDNGYIPGVNLFFIFGDKDGHVDSLQISRVIAEIRGI